MVSAKIMDSVNSDIRGKNFYLSLELEKQGHKILKLNTGNPATFGFGMPDSLRKAIYDNLDKTVGYCDVRGIIPARQAIYDYHKSKGLVSFTMDDIFVGNGVSEIASMVCTAIFEPGDEVLVPTPCYSLWNNEITLRGAKPVFYRCDPNSGWNPDVEHIKSLVNKNTKAILIINPNNPTGVLYTNETILEIIEIARQNKLILMSDEIYDRLVFDGKKHTSTAALADDITVITMNGLSKSHCVCGWRCGWLVTTGPEPARTEITTALLKLASVRLSSNAIMQTVIAAALEDSEYTNDMIKVGGSLYERRRATLEALDKIEGVSYVKNDASFYVFPKIHPEVMPIVNDKKFAEELLREKHILIVPGSGFAAEEPDRFRIVMLPDPDTLSDAVGKIGEFIQEHRI